MGTYTLYSKDSTVDAQGQQIYRLYPILINKLEKVCEAENLWASNRIMF